MPFGHHPCVKPPHPDFYKPRLWLDDFAPNVIPPDSTTANWASRVPSFPMDLNDQLGDCGITGMDHYQMSESQYGSGSSTSWGDSTCLQLYEQLGGYVQGDPSTDNGTVLQDNLNFWRNNAINGSKILAFGALRSWNWRQRLHALHAFGPGYIGMSLPQSAEQQFPGDWTLVPGSPPAGGHCVTIAAELMSTDDIRLTTWGAVVKASRAFFMATVSEYWVIITEAGIERNGVNQYGWDVTGMNEALAALTGQSNPLKLKTIV